MIPVIIFWFRRDLRLVDNHGFSQALVDAKQRGLTVLPIFIFDSGILGHLPRSDARVQFIHQQLASMDKTLKAHASSLFVKHGQVLSVFADLILKFRVEALYYNHDYEPDAIQRDIAVRQLMAENQIDCKSFKDHVIFERDNVIKKNGQPYTVFTPYKKAWLKKFDLNSDVTEFNCDLAVCTKHSARIPTLEELDFKKTDILVEDYDFDAMEGYQNRRDFPADDLSTSKLSPHLRFGTVSIRKCVRKALMINDVFLSELVWREFFSQVLWHFPHVKSQSFRPEYDLIDWRCNCSEFKAWCEGRTGYPFVDAGMRELNQTGYMHNRVRMVTASFLCKHLLIDWRWGERYFAEKLLDYELSSNNGNWQWAAGTGCDAAPYFRIFNPEIQLKKFDPEKKYIHQFLTSIDLDAEPIVDHKFARERCLAAYRAARAKFAS